MIIQIASCDRRQGQRTGSAGEWSTRDHDQAPAGRWDSNAEGEHGPAGPCDADDGGQAEGSQSVVGGQGEQTCVVVVTTLWSTTKQSNI